MTTSERIRERRASDYAERLRARRDSIGRDLARAYLFGRENDAQRLEQAYRKASDALFDADIAYAELVKP